MKQNELTGSVAALNDSLGIIPEVKNKISKRVDI